MGRASRRKRHEAQQRQYFDIHGDARDDAARARARATLDALQRKLDDDAQREDGFYFVDGKYVDARRPRVTPGMRTQSFSGHDRRICAVAVVALPAPLVRGPEGNALVVTFGVDRIRIWEMKDGEAFVSLDVSGARAMSICGAAAIVPEGLSPRVLIAFATHQEPLLRVFNVETRELGPPPDFANAPWCAVGIGHQQQITCMALTSATSHLVTGSMDSTCGIWRLHSDKPTDPTLLCLLPASELGVSACALTVEDAELVTAGGEATVKIWDVGDVGPEAEAELKGASLAIQETRWTAAMPFTMSTTATLERLLFDDLNPSLLINSDWVHERCLEGLRRTQALVEPPRTLEDVISVEDIDDEVLDAVHALTAQVEADNNQDVDGDSDRERSATEDQAQGSNQHEVIDPTFATATPALSGSVERLRKHYETMERFDFDRLLDPSAPLRGHASTSCQRTHARPRLAFDAKHRLIRQCHRRKLNGDFASHTSRITACAVAKEVDVVVTVSLDRSIVRWSFGAGHVLGITREAHTAPITCCAITSPTTSAPDLEVLLATGAKDNALKIWRRVADAELELVYTLLGHYDALTAVAFDPRGIFVVSTSDDTHAHCWRVRPAPPDAPRQPQIVRVDRFAITVAWDEPLANGSALGRYIVRTEQLTSFYGDEDRRVIPDVEIAVKYKTATIEGLQPGIQYRIAVAAVNGVGQSLWSPTTEAIETLAFTPSKVELAVQYSDIGTTSVALMWRAPSANGAPITSYTVRALPENRFFVPECDVDVAIESLVVVEPEAPKVRRVPQSKAKAKPKTISTQQREAAPKVPGGHHRTNTQYRHVLDGLWPGEVYQFVVAAVNRCGRGGFSPFSDYIKMESTAPDAPLRPEIAHVDKREAEVTWVKPRCNGSEILQYIVAWTQQATKALDDPTAQRDCDRPDIADGVDDQGRTRVVLLTKSIVGTTYTLTGLRPGRPLRVWVAATNLIHRQLCASPYSPPSASTCTPCDVPDTPQSPQILTPTSHSLVVAFAPPEDNGSAIARYQLVLTSEELQFGIITSRVVRDLDLTSEELEDDQAATVEAPAATARVLRWTITRLRARTFYSAAVRAVNGLGPSPMSPKSQAVTTLPPTVPATITTAPIISEIAPTRARLRWEPPIHDGGAPIASTIVQYQIHGGPWEHEILLFEGRELVLEQLKPKATYAFRIMTANAMGRAEPSPASGTFTTPSLVEHTITTYFATRPPIEHAKARVLQRRYRLVTRRRLERSEYLRQLTEVLAGWHIL